MELYKILFYFGLTIILVQGIKLFPFKTALWPKILQQFLLLVIHIIVIFLIPKSSLVVAVVLFFITVLFTMVADAVRTRFYQHFFTCYLQQSPLPELIHLLNWDFHSLALVKSKKLFSLLEQNNEKTATAILDQLRKYPGLNRHPLWRQDLLQILHYTHHIELANSCISTWAINLAQPGMPYGLVSALMNIHLTDNNFEAAYEDLAYLQTHYRDNQHRMLNLMNTLTFYAQAGATVDFNLHLSSYPELLENPAVQYWRSILLLRTGKQEEAFTLLSGFRQKLPDNLKYFGHYVDKILENPGYYPPVTNITVPAAAMPSSLSPEQAAQPGARKTTSDIPLYLLCGIIAVITLIQFFLAGPASVNDFIRQSGITNYDFIRAGAYSYPLVQAGQWVRLVTAVFLHANWLHLFLNLYGLFVIGRFIGRVYGSRQFYFLFFFSGIMGNLFSHFIDKFPVGVGASGGVFGLMAAMLIYVFWNRKTLHRDQFYRFLVNFAIVIGINLVYGIQNKAINNTAHIAGFLSGGAAALGCVFIMNKPGSIKKIFNTASGIFSMLIFAITVSLWPLLFFYDYPGKITLNKPGNSNGYSYQAAASWKNDTEGQFTDILAGAIISLVKTAVPAELYTADGTPGIQEYIQEQLELLLSADKQGNQWLIHKQVTALADGWYVFALGRKKGVGEIKENEEIDEADPYNYKWYWYTKLFPASLCWVQDSCPGKYAAQYQALMLRFLSTVQETYK